MKNILILTFLLRPLCYPQELSIYSNAEEKNNFSFGFFDGRTGHTFISYSHDYYQKEKNELFMGFGTFIINTNISLGWKHYFSKKTLSPFSTTSLHYSFTTARPEESAVFPSITIGLEYEFLKKCSTQFGFLFAAMKTNYGIEYAIWPHVNFDYRF